VLPDARTKAIRELNPTLPSAAATHKKKTEKNLSVEEEKMYVNKIRTKISSRIRRLNAFFLLKGIIIKININAINANESVIKPGRN